MNFKTTRTPNEFLVVPAKPLETPPESSALPVPTPGVANRADATPLEDAVTALGGSAAALKADGPIPSSDGGLVNYASRYGRDPAVRDSLSEEDAAYRKRNQGRILERVFSVNRYFDAYDGQSLDQQTENERLRALGVPTSSAPPVALKPD
ncbi:DUF3035 domain-containing protein [Rhodobacteraceae bacterium SC52]|uniref:DUF3035 domain-containing protein n=2 Tax=Meridianimarinicoccus aquatilis TaxID=2552766 RepID=A0A4R6AP94_9RHOB|nr:DUF3035 domain-containing protein [Rhodobacteraceae bacterium SC52]TDL85335.1 DUF3035 domain-containing protein [Fluviibacterium aquatile]